ncbi:hypothetical protein DFJ73DRAFT_852992 [Zopfochytrium polystomum]|nr:hypothetical protein DFJ73DRAFT_852992 [Zopfochytrium polystomum]
MLPATPLANALAVASSFSNELGAMISHALVLHLARSLVIIHAALSALAVSGSSVALNADHTSELRAEMVALILLPFVGSRTQTVSGASLKTFLSGCKAFFSQFVVADEASFDALIQLDYEVTAMIPAVACHVDENCLECMRFRILLSFFYRWKDEHEFSLFSYEEKCIASLNLQTPTTLRAAKLMISDIATRPPLLHSKECLSFYAHRSIQETVHSHMRMTALALAVAPSFRSNTAPPEAVFNSFLEFGIDRALERQPQQTQPSANAKEPLNDVTTPADISVDFYAPHHQETVDVLLKGSATGSVWTVHFHDRAEKAIRRLAKKNQGALIPVLKNIQMVAEGVWTPSIAASLVAPGCPIAIFECKVLNNLRVVWQVDVTYLEAISMHSQVIKIWCIGNHSDVDNVVKYIEAAQRVYSQEHILRCKRRNFSGGLAVPVTWEDDGGDSHHVVRLDSFHDADPNEALRMHEMAVTAKFIPLSKVFMRWLLAGSGAPTDCEFPFAVSQQEHEILAHTKSLIICGRSGTGKTSCLVFRLLAQFHARNVQNDLDNESANRTKQRPRFRQIFLTASPKFCNRVKRYYNQLRTSLAPPARPLHEIEEILKKLSDKSSTSVGNVEYEDDNAMVDLTSTQGADDGALLDLDDGSSELPNSFADIPDSEFPIFVHYKKFISMLRIHVGIADDYDVSQANVEAAADRSADFHRFQNIFKSLPKNMTNGIDEWLAFNEIMGVIKGTELAARSLEGCLTREQYLNVSVRAHAVFTHHRGQIYDIFEAYQARKLQDYIEYMNGKRSEKPSQLDEIDRVNELNRALDSMRRQRDEKLQELMVHQFYVDEVQDSTMSQILPLLSVCADPCHGLMFAGDTAQVISRGSAFRFEDLSAMIHHELKDSGMPDCRPTISNLSKNYRSHDGILSVAASVLDLLRFYFPTQIDHLPREAGTIVGPRPVIVTSQDTIKTFLSGGDASSEPIDFGAGQVILVRNVEDAIQLKRELNMGFVLILTVEQAKGMEFRDVVLHNIFTNSPASENKWRLFLGNLMDKDTKHPEFDSQKHSVLSTELKILYTAITRARSRLWLWDSDKNKRMPLFKFWSEQNLIATSDDAEASKFRANSHSTPDEWNAQGRLLFENGRYEDALASFKNGLKAANVNSSSKSVYICLCEAYIHRLEAQKEQAGQKLDRASKLFRKAGMSFMEAYSYNKNLPDNQLTEGALCFEQAGDLTSAATMYAFMRLPSAKGIACFRQIQRWDLAGQSLERLKRYREALDEYCRTGSGAVDALRLLRSNGSALLQDKPLVRQVSSFALAHIPKSQAENRKVAISILPDLAEKKGMYRVEKMYKDLVALLAESGEVEEAADAADMYLGDLKWSAELFLSLPRERGLVPAMKCRLREWWQTHCKVIDQVLVSDFDLKQKPLPDFTPSNDFIELFSLLQDMKEKNLKEPWVGSVHWVELVAVSSFSQLRSIHSPTTLKLTELFSVFKLNAAVDLRLFMECHLEADDLLINLQSSVKHSLAVAYVGDILCSALRPSSDWPIKGDITLAYFDSLYFPAMPNRRDILEDIEFLFGARPMDETGKIVAPVDCFGGRTQVDGVRGVVLDRQTARFEAFASDFFSLALSRIEKLVTRTGRSVLDNIRKSGLLHPFCASQWLHKRCHLGETCPYTHSVPKLWKSMEMRFFVSLARLSRRVIEGERLLGRNATFATHELERFIAALDPWGLGTSDEVLWIVDASSVSSFPEDVKKTIIMAAKSMMTDLWKAVDGGKSRINLEIIVKCCFVYRSFEVGSTSRIFGALHAINQYCESIKAASLKDVVGMIVKCVFSRGNESFVTLVKDILGEIVASDKAYVGDLTAICWLVELASGMLLFLSMNQFLLPRYIIGGVFSQVGSSILKPSSPPPILKAQFELKLSALIANVGIMEAEGKAKTVESSLARLAMCNLLLHQDKLAGQSLIKALPPWLAMLDDDWSALCQLTKGLDVVFCWRSKLTTSEFTWKARKLAQFHLAIDEITTYSPGCAKLLELDTKFDNTARPDIAANISEAASSSRKSQQANQREVKAEMKAPDPKLNAAKNGGSPKTPVASPGPASAQQKSQKNRPVSPEPLSNDDGDGPPALVEISDTESEPEPDPITRKGKKNGPPAKPNAHQGSANGKQSRVDMPSTSSSSGQSRSTSETTNGAGSGHKDNSSSGVQTRQGVGPVEEKSAKTIIRWWRRLRKYPRRAATSERFRRSCTAEHVVRQWPDVRANYKKVFLGATLQLYLDLVDATLTSHTVCEHLTSQQGRAEAYHDLLRLLERKDAATRITRLIDPTHYLHSTFDVARLWELVRRGTAALEELEEVLEPYADIVGSSPQSGSKVKTGAAIQGVATAVHQPALASPAGKAIKANGGASEVPESSAPVPKPPTTAAAGGHQRKKNKKRNQGRRG